MGTTIRPRIAEGAIDQALKNSAEEQNSVEASSGEAVPAQSQELGSLDSKLAEERLKEMTSGSETGILGRSAAARLQADPKKTASFSDGIAEETRSLISPLVDSVLHDAQGQLDLSKVPAKNFQEFKKFLLDQVAVDGMAFNEWAAESFHWKGVWDSYRRALASPDFEPLLERLYVEYHPEAELSSHLPLAEVERRLRSFSKDLISVSTDRFAGAHLDSKEGRERIRAILNDEGYDAQLRTDLIRSISRVKAEEGDCKLFVHNIRELTSTVDVVLFSLNVHNIGMKAGDLEAATRQTLSILRTLDESDAFKKKRQNQYLEHPEKVDLLAGVTVEELQAHAALTEVFEDQLETKSDKSDPRSKLRSKLAGLWLMAADRAHWGSTDIVGSNETRAYLLQQSEQFLQKLYKVETAEQFQALSAEIRQFLKNPPPKADRALSLKIDGFLQEHLEIQTGLNDTIEDLVKGMGSAEREPFDALLKFTDEIWAAKEMGEAFRLEIKAQAEEPQVLEAANQFIQGLEGAKRQLWYGYKQQGTVSRGLSQSAETIGTEGAISKIRSGNAAIDEVIAEAQKAKTPEELKQAYAKLYEQLKDGGKLHQAFKAAEMDGTEQLIGLGQSMALTLAISAVTEGAGGVNVALKAISNAGKVSRAMKGVSTAAKVAKGFDQFKKVHKGLSLARTAKKMSDAEKVLSAGEKAIKGFKLGAQISTAENLSAKLSGQLRTEPQTIIEWAKAAFATGASMALTAPLAEGSEASHATKTAIKKLWQRYTKDLSQGAMRLARDVASEVVEEAVDAYVKANLDGNYQGLSWDEFRDIATLCIAGGGAEKGLSNAMIGGGKKILGRSDREPNTLQAKASSKAPSIFNPLFAPMWAALGAGGLGGGAKVRKMSASIQGKKESPRVSPKDLSKQLIGLQQKLGEVLTQLPEERAQAYQTELSLIEWRRGFWVEQQARLQELDSEESARFAEDIAIGIGLLSQRLLRVGAEIFQEPLSAESLQRWGLRYQFRRELRVKPKEAAEKQADAPISALINHDAGYGMALSLRDHQMAALHALRGRLLLLASLEAAEALTPDALLGTIVMPVGGGKTRAMMGGFALALELGRMEPAAGDKFIILNHTDQIHRQNLEVAELLGPYFKEITGRSLKISEYKAEKKEVDGDVIVLSIPTVQSEASRRALQESLREALGEKGKVAMVAIDEVHHLGLAKGKTLETWAEAISALRELSPNLFQVGFTATPTGKEGSRIFTLRERELMQARVTPRTYLVKVDGIDLSQLKVTASGEFENRSLQSTLLGHPKRNQRIYEALAQQGLISERPSPSGRKKLEPVLAFGQDLAHAAMMAKQYVEHFQNGQKPEGGTLHGRRLHFLGENRGKVSAQELDQALEAYRRGEVDGIVALVSGDTKGRREPLLQAVERGEIEAVFTVDALLEGADLHMFTHQVGARPTFSRFTKGQERGRINRRGPDQVSVDGKLLRDPPKVLFDVIDRYAGERPLIRYGDVMGVAGHSGLESGKLFDVLNGGVVAQAARETLDFPALAEDSPNPARRRQKKTIQEWDFTPLVQDLQGVLDRHYDGDIETMALDLGVTESFVEGLLSGEEWENNRWFLKRLATLLYQERRKFVSALHRDYVAAFQRALEIVEAEGKIVSPNALSKLAYQLYVEGLPEAEHPSQGAFGHMVGGTRADPKILALMEASLWVQKQNRTSLDRTRAQRAFQRALEGIAAERKKVNPQSLASFAHQFYSEDLPEAEIPSLWTFRCILSGPGADAEILGLIEASPWVQKQNRTAPDRTRAQRAFQRALEAIEAEGKKTSPNALFRLAHQFYCEGLSESEYPSPFTFRNMINPSGGDPQILALIEASPWIQSRILVKKSPVSLDKSRVRKVFITVLERVEAESKTISPHGLSKLAHQLYCEDLSEAEQPTHKAFESMVTGPYSSPEILALMEASPWVRRQRQSDKSQTLQAFQQALETIEAQGREVTAQSIADLAHQFYGKGLPESERPSQQTFRKMVSGASANPEISGLVQSSPYLQKKKQTSLDEARVQEAFHRALDRIEEEKKNITPQALARLAHQFYSEGLPESEQPSWGTFRSIVRGASGDPDIVRLVQDSSYVQKKKQISLDKARVQKAFQRALDSIETEKRTVSPHSFSHLVYQFYSEDLPEAETPSWKTFQHLVRGDGSPEILALIEASPWVQKRSHVSLEKSRVQEVFQIALERIGSEGKKINPSALSELAYQLYVEGLPESERPSQGSFRTWVSGPQADSKILALMEASPWVWKRKQVLPDKARTQLAFHRALEMSETGGKRMSATALANLAHQFYVEGLPEAEHPSQKTFQQMVSGVRADREILSMIAKSSAVIGEKAEETLPKPDVADGVKLAGLVAAGLSTLLSSNEAHAAVRDAGSHLASGPGGMALAAGLAAGAVAMVRLVHSKKSPFLRKGPAEVVENKDFDFDEVNTTTILESFKIDLAKGTPRVPGLRRQNTQPASSVFRIEALTPLSLHKMVDFFRELFRERKSFEKQPPSESVTGREPFRRMPPGQEEWFARFPSEDMIRLEKRNRDRQVSVQFGEDAVGSVLILGESSYLGAEGFKVEQLIEIDSNSPIPSLQPSYYNLEWRGNEAITRLGRALASPSMGRDNLLKDLADFIVASGLYTAEEMGGAILDASTSRENQLFKEAKMELLGAGRDDFFRELKTEKRASLGRPLVSITHQLHPVENVHVLSVHLGNPGTERFKEAMPLPASWLRILDGFLRNRPSDPPPVGGSSHSPASIGKIRLRGEDKAAGPPVHVGADVTDKAAKSFSKQQLTVRQRGIQSYGDIGSALDYIGRLHPSFANLVAIVRKRDLPIHLGLEELTYSYATPTFQGLVDRNAPDFGKSIVIQLGGTPDILLHEILHAVPLQLLRELLPADLFPIDSLNIPAIVPSAPYRSIREAIFENIRANETMSFGVEGLFYQLERRRGVNPVFNSAMMSKLDGAWRQGGLTAIRETFPHYLPHYESRLGLSSAILALIVKVEGRTQLTEEEVAFIESSAKEEIPYANLLKRFQGYLDRHVESLGLDVPVDFYSLTSILRRVQIHELKDLSADTLVSALDAAFESLQAWERPLPRETEIQPRAADIVPPPDGSLPARAQLLRTYAELADRVLENPPGAFSREELASLVSYARMVTPQAAGELAERLEVYLGKGFEDLRVGLGLILQEKGLAKAAWQMVEGSVDAENLSQVLPWVLRLMGEKRAEELLIREHSRLLGKRETAKRQFQIWAGDRFLFEDPRWESAARDLFGYPQWFSEKSWEQFAAWLFERGPVDSSLEEDDLFSFPRGFSEAFESFGKSELAFLETLDDLRKSEESHPALRASAEGAWEEWRIHEAGAWRALARMYQLGRAPVSFEAIRLRSPSLSLCSKEELESLVSAFPASQRRRVHCIVETHGSGPWTYPEEVGRLAAELGKTLQTLQNKTKGEYDSQMFLAELALFELLNRSKDKHRRNPEEGAPKFSPVLARLLRLPAYESEESKTLNPSHAAMIARYFHAFYPTDGIARKPISDGLRDEYCHQVRRCILAIENDPSHRAGYYKAALESFGNALRRYFPNKDALSKQRLTRIHADLLDKLFGHHGLLLLLMAKQQGESEVAEVLLDLLFRKIPTEIRRAEILSGPDGAGECQFMKKWPSFEWAFRMDAAREAAVSEGRVEEWLGRIRDEIQRGSSAVSPQGLDFLSREFGGESAHAHLEEMLRLMVQKSLIEPSQENIQVTVRCIHESPLSEDARDRILEGLLRPLLDMVKQHQGLNLALLHRLQSIFPWRAPFLRPEEVPNYRRTEELLVIRMAKIPELSETQSKKDDRLRLAALVTVGIPLQRYSEWAVSIFPGLSPRRNYDEIYKQAGLPHPNSVPAEISPDQGRVFLQTHGPALEGMLKKGEGEREAALRLFFRNLGSELRYLTERPASSKDAFSKSTFVAYLGSWLEKQRRVGREDALTAQVEELIFSAGPPELHRLEFARSLLAVAGTRERTRRIFERATQHLAFSSRVERRLAALREKSPEEEMKYLRLLLWIDYRLHPRRMVSNLFLDRLERDLELRKEYTRFLESGEGHHPAIVSELGLSTANDKVTLLKDWSRSRNIDRLELYLEALKFLRDYLEVEKSNDWADEYNLRFKISTVREHRLRFSSDLQGVASLPESNQENELEDDEVPTWDPEIMEGISAYRIHEYSEILSFAGWAVRISEILDLVSASRKKAQVPLAYNENKPEVREVHDFLEDNIQQTEGLYRSMILEDLQDRMEDIRLPHFIESRRGLERDLLVWTLDSLEPSQRQLLEQQLDGATNDQARFRILGEAAHLEKLLQAGSVHPAVPKNFQEQFAIFQDEVPHRDPIEIDRTLENAFAGVTTLSLKVDTRRPIREGTIGGIYQGSLNGRPVVVKVISDVKEQNIRSSLRLIRDIRRYLWAGRYQEPGARSVDDFLAFCERTIPEELDLGREIDKAKLLREILPEGFAVPEVDGRLRDPFVLLMEPLHSRRLRDLDGKQLEELFHRVDTQLIRAMLSSGTFHYDLHPGNLGLHEDGRIILYDVGRVHRLSEAQRQQASRFFLALMQQELKTLPEFLVPLGEVRDLDAFANIGDLLAEFAVQASPFKALESIYPRLADYGFRLHDDYVRLLLMFLTWEGTKASLRRA